MTVQKRGNSGYLMGDASDLIKPDTDSVVGFQGIHTLADVRVYEKRGIWSTPTGFNAKFHTTGSVNGVSITKDMQNQSSHTWPQNAHSGTSGGHSGMYFNDWANDVWDAWGYWGIHYYSQVNSTWIYHEPVQFGTSINNADGVFVTNTWTANDGTNWKVRHGHPVACMWMMCLTCETANTDFRVNMGGNMGSDGSTQTRDGYNDVTISTGQSMRIHWRENSDSGSFNSNEQVRWYCFPTGVGGSNQYGTGTSTNVWHTSYVTGDNHYIYSGLNTEQSFTLYMAKGNDNSSTTSWVADDLALV